MEKNTMQKMMEMCGKMSMEECQSMMQNMMSGRSGTTDMENELNKQIMGTPELQLMFMEWCHLIKKEMEEFIKEKNSSDMSLVSKHFNLSESSCDYLLNKINK